MTKLFRRTDEGWVVQVRLIPNASKDGIDTVISRGENSFLKVKVRAIPEKGKANKALCSVLAKHLRLPKSSLEVISGHKSRTKGVLIRAPEMDLEQQLNLSGKH